MADGSGRNSPYTEMLLKQMNSDNNIPGGLDVTGMFGEVSWQFRQKHNGQRPELIIQGVRPKTYYLGSVSAANLNSDVQTSNAAASGETVLSQTVESGNTSRDSLEALLWQSAERGNSVEEYQAYIAQFPNGTFTRIAQTRIDRLKRNRPTTVDPIENEATVQMTLIPQQDNIALDSRRQGSENNAESALSLKIYPPPDRRDSVKAFNLYHRCEDGNPDGCRKLAQLYQNGGIGVKKDLERAAGLYAKGCVVGDIYGCIQAGHPEYAVELYKKECFGGNLDGCSNLGIMYENGKGVKEDLGRAVRLYTKACDGGNPDGCSNLGSMYEKGKGVKKDVERAIELKWWRAKSNQ